MGKPIEQDACRDGLPAPYPSPTRDTPSIDDGKFLIGTIFEIRNALHRYGAPAGCCQCKTLHRGWGQGSKMTSLNRMPSVPSVPRIASHSQMTDSLRIQTLCPASISVLKDGERGGRILRTRGGPNSGAANRYGFSLPANAPASGCRTDG